MKLSEVVKNYLATRDVCNAYGVDLETSVRMFDEFQGRPATAADLSAISYADFATWLKPKCKTATTVNNRLRQLKTVWFYAAELRQCDNPPRKLKRLRESPAPIVGWNVEQFGKLLEVLESQLREPSPLADYFLESFAPTRELTPESHRVMAAAMRRFDRFSSNAPVAAVSLAMVAEFFTQLGNDVGQQTAVNIRGHVLTVLRHAWSSPAGIVTVRSSITNDAAIARAALWLGWNTGLRRGDLFAARREALAGNQLTIRQNKTGREIRRNLWPQTLAALQAVKHTGPTLLPRKSMRRVGEVIKDACRVAGVPAGVFKFARRGSASEVERIAPGTGWKHCGHTSPDVFPKHYAIQSICGDAVPEPPMPAVSPG